MGNITSIVFDKESAKTIYKELWQYDYGQILRIEGLNLPKAVEIHFSLQETGGEAKRRIGITDSGVTDVVIPDFILEGNKTTRDYYGYAFIYLADEESGETTHKIKMSIKSRPEPEGNTGRDDTSFGAIMAAVNKIAESAVSDEQVQNAVNKYLDENPIEAVSDEQLAEAVFGYLQENPIEGVTDEQVASAVKAYLLEHPVTGGTISAEQIAQAVSEYMEENPIETGATKEQAEQIKKNTQDIGKLSEQKVDKQDGYSMVSDSEKQEWNNKSDFSGSYNDLKDKPEIPTASGGEKWELIIDTIIEEDLQNFTISKDINGNSFDLKEIVFKVEFAIPEDEAWTNNARTCISFNNQAYDKRIAEIGTSSKYGEANPTIIVGHIALNNGIPVGVFYKSYNTTDAYYKSLVLQSGLSCFFLYTNLSSNTEIKEISIGSYLKCLPKNSKITVHGIRK